MGRLLRVHGPVLCELHLRGQICPLDFRELGFQVLMTTGQHHSPNGAFLLSQVLTRTLISDQKGANVQVLLAEKNLLNYVELKKQSSISRLCSKISFFKLACSSCVSVSDAANARMGSQSTHVVIVLALVTDRITQPTG